MIARKRKKLAILIEHSKKLEVELLITEKIGRYDCSFKIGNSDCSFNYKNWRYICPIMKKMGR
jgi:hypothetical protein